MVSTQVLLVHFTLWQLNEGDEIDFDDLLSQITENTKEELIHIGKIENENNLILFSDEMYEHFIYDDLEFTSTLNIEALKDHTIVILGFSKIYSVIGWILGYAISTKKVIDNASSLNDLVYVCPSAPLLYAVKRIK